MASPEDAEDPLQLCVEILKDGYADAFIQFFSLSHPPEPEEDAAPAEATPALGLATVKEQLMEAEESARRGARPSYCARACLAANAPRTRCALAPARLHTPRAPSSRAPPLRRANNLSVSASTVRHRPLRRRVPVVPDSRRELRRSGSVWNCR